MSQMSVLSMRTGEGTSEEQWQHATNQNKLLDNEKGDGERETARFKLKDKKLSNLEKKNKKMKD